MARSPLFVVVLLATTTISGCRIFGSDIPCNASSDCPTRFPVCTARGDATRVCVAEGEGPPVEGDGGVPRHDGGPDDDAGPPPDDGGPTPDDGGPIVVDGGPTEDGGALDAGPVTDPCPLFAIEAVETVCLAQQMTQADVYVTGDGFILAPSGDTPTVTVGDVEAAQVALLDCRPLRAGGEVCASMIATLPTVPAAGSYAVVVENTAGFGCGEAIGSVHVATRPVLSAPPDKVCDGSVVVLEGTGLGSSPRVSLDGTEADYVESYSGATKRHLAYFSSLPLSGMGDLVIENEGCAAGYTVSYGEVPALVDVHPTVHFLEGPSPLVVQWETPWTSPWGTLYGNDIYMDLDAWPQASSELLFAVPFTGLAEGEYTLVTSTETGRCPAVMPYGIQRSTSTVSLPVMIPSTGAAGTLPVSAPWPLETGGAADLSGPHDPTLWLIDEQGQIRFQRARPHHDGRLLLDEPFSELSPGLYTVYASDSHGTVGSAGEHTHVVTTQDDPRIERVLGGDVPFSGGTLTLVGQNLTSNTGGTVVRLVCTGASSSIETTTTSASATSMEVAVPTVTLSLPGCIVVLERGDGALALAGGVRLHDPFDPAPGPFTLQPELQVARRGVAAAVFERSSYEAVLWVVGGDDGDFSPVVERTTLGPLGPLAPWRYDRELPEGRRGASAVVVGSYVYVVGGETSTGPTASVLRARILDERDAPILRAATVEPRSASSGGLWPGLYHYAVTAVRASGDQLDPGGETVPSALVPVRVRAETPGPVAVRLTWDPSSVATGYRVYRTYAGGEPWEAELLAEVPGQASSEFVDDDTSSVGGARPPAVTELGTWHEAMQLQAAYVGSAAVAYADASGGHMIAVTGGLANGAASDQVEVVRIFENTDSSHLTSAMGTGPTLTSARYGHGVAVFEQSPAERFLIVGPGLPTATATLVASISSDSGDPSGLSLWTSTSSGGATQGSGGYGFVTAYSYLLMLGGQAGAASTSVLVAEACTPSCPSVSAFDSSPRGLQQARTDAAAASVFGRVVVLGGADGNGGVLSTVESTVE